MLFKNFHCFDDVTYGRLGASNDPKRPAIERGCLKVIYVSFSMKIGSNVTGTRMDMLKHMCICTCS